jgi:hypothetical protein
LIGARESLWWALKAVLAGTFAAVVIAYALLNLPNRARAIVADGLRLLTGVAGVWWGLAVLGDRSAGENHLVLAFAIGACGYLTARILEPYAADTIRRSPRVLVTKLAAPLMDSITVAFAAVLSMLMTVDFLLHGFISGPHQPTLAGEFSQKRPLRSRV